MRKRLSRRDLIKGSAALGLTAFAAPAKAAAPEPVAITSALVDAARKEAKVTLYSSMDLAVVDRLQHQPGEAGRRAEKFCGSARSEMGRQDGQGPSRL